MLLVFCVVAKHVLDIHAIGQYAGSPIQLIMAADKAMARRLGFLPRPNCSISGVGCDAGEKSAPQKQGKCSATSWGENLRATLLSRGRLWYLAPCFYCRTIFSSSAVVCSRRLPPGGGAGRVKYSRAPPLRRCREKEAFARTTRTYRVPQYVGTPGVYDSLALVFI